MSEKLKEWRKDQDLSLQSLAKMLDCSPITIMKWEKGGAITPPLRRKWKEVFDIDVKELFGLSEREY